MSVWVPWPQPINALYEISIESFSNSLPLTVGGREIA
jgi:hypothetical protein